MSSAWGAVRFPDGIVKFYWYSGTADVCIAQLWDTVEEFVLTNRYEAGFPKCVCGRDEPVRIYCDYGGGSSFDGRACRACRTITDDGDFVLDYPGGYTQRRNATPGMPDWAEPLWDSFVPA